MAAPASPSTGAAVEHGPGGAKSGKTVKLIALALIVAVIGGECLAAVLFLASAGHDAPAKPAESKTASVAADASGDSQAEEEATADEPAAAPEHPDPVDRRLPAGPAAAGDFEVNLGQFSLTVYQPAAGTTLLVDFHLYGTIHSKDEVAFNERLEKNKHRIRDQIIVTIRSAELADLSDPGLGLIKRQILEKSNTLLGKRLLRSIMFSDFTFIEQ